MTRIVSVGSAMVLCMGLALGSAWAQQPGATAPAGAPEAAAPSYSAPAPLPLPVPEKSGPEQGSLWWFIKCGGWLMYVIAALSVLGVALIVYFFTVMRTSQIAPRALQRELVGRIRAGSMEEVRQECEDTPSPLAAVALAAVDYMEDAHEPDPAVLRDVIEGEGSRQAESIQGQTQYLLDVAVIAPMVGLLGTIFGMMRAFGSVARDIASARPVVLAEGVAQALITTAFGLIVGIPAMMFYAYFRRRASRQISYLETASTDVLTALLSRGKPQSAPRPPAGERAVFARLRTNAQ